MYSYWIEPWYKGLNQWKQPLPGWHINLSIFLFMTLTNLAICLPSLAFSWGSFQRRKGLHSGIIMPAHANCFSQATSFIIMHVVNLVRLLQLFICYYLRIYYVQALRAKWKPKTQRGRQRRVKTSLTIFLSRHQLWQLSFSFLFALCK